MTSVAYGIALPASRGVLTAQAAPSWLPAGKTIFADIPNGRYWAAGRLRPNLASWLAAVGATFSGEPGRTYTTAANLVAAVGLDQPRITHVGGVPHLLYEPAATNVLPQSNAFNLWSVQLATVATGIPGPDGATSAARLVEDTSAIYHRVQQTSASTAGQVAGSVWAKAAERSFLCINDNAGNDLFLNAGDGTYGNVAAKYTPAPTVAYAGGWYRFSFTFVAIANQMINVFVAQANGVRNYAGDGTSGICIYGTQLEAGAAASSYIATTSAAAPRAAESIGGIVAPGNLSVTFDDNSTQVISAANFANPANLSRSRIKGIAA